MSTLAQPKLTTLCLLLLCGLMSTVRAAQDTVACKILADDRLQDPLGAICTEYMRRTQVPVAVTYQSESEINSLVSKQQTQYDVVLCMPAEIRGETAVESLPGARKVAWKYPSGEAVWTAVIGKHPSASSFVSFVGGPTGHQLWSASTAGFTITSGKSHAEAFDWVAEHRVKHTYPLTAVRMLRGWGGFARACASTSAAARAISTWNWPNGRTLRSSVWTLIRT